MSKRDARYAASVVLAVLVMAALWARAGIDVFALGPAAPGGAVAHGTPLVAAGGAQTGFPGLPVDLNTASAEDLTALPGIGERTAAVILAMRTERGAFRSVSELGEIKWMGGARLARLEGLLAVSPDRHFEGKE